MCTVALTIVSCINKDQFPSAETKEATIASRSEVILNATVNPHNQVTSVFFEFGVTDRYGQVIIAEPHQIGWDKEIGVSASLNGPRPETEYHYRVKAESLCGVTFGKDLTFVVSAEPEILFNKDIVYGNLTDQEGNDYKTVNIGSQTWMAENLRTTILNDGTAISFIPDENTWETLRSPGYSWYKYHPDIYNYRKVYGALYNFYAVQTMKLCPAGWHIPTEAEWYILFSRLGGLGVCAGKLKEAGTTHWMSPNAGATNESGFTALPGGFHRRKSTGIRANGYWWNTFQVTPGTSIRIPGLTFDDPYIDILLPDENNGSSVRCLKN